MNKKKLLILLGVVILVSAIVVAALSSGRGLSLEDKRALLEARGSMWVEYVEQVPEIRSITWLPEGKLLVFTNSSEEAEHVALNILTDQYKGWPVEVTYKELSPDDMWVLIEAAEAMAGEYKHVPEIDGTTWLWPEGEIVVDTMSWENAVYVALNVVPGMYRGWPVVVLYSEIFMPSLTALTDELDPNFDRWEVVRPLVGGVLVQPYIEPSSGGGGGGGGGENRPLPEPYSQTWEVLQEQSQYASDYYIAAGSGTLGMVTYNDKILSCAHVIAMDPDTAAFLDIGTPILQPYGLENQVGELEAYISISLSSDAQNYADAAIASTSDGIDESRGEIFDEQANYTISGWTTVSVGDTVRKSGIMTNTTTAKVTDTSKSFTTRFNDNTSLHFVDHIEVRLVGDYFARFGDSGSVVDKDGEFVGLVQSIRYRYWPWPIGTLRDSWAYITKAEHIIDGLGISLEPAPGGGGGGGSPLPEPYSWKAKG